MRTAFAKWIGQGGRPPSRTSCEDPPLPKQLQSRSTSHGIAHTSPQCRPSYEDINVDWSRSLLGSLEPVMYMCVSTVLCIMVFDYVDFVIFRIFGNVRAGAGQILSTRLFKKFQSRIKTNLNPTALGRKSHRPLFFQRSKLRVAQHSTSIIDGPALSLRRSWAQSSVQWWSFRSHGLRRVLLLISLSKIACEQNKHRERRRGNSVRHPIRSDVSDEDTTAAAI